MFINSIIPASDFVTKAFRLYLSKVFSESQNISVMIGHPVSILCNIDIHIALRLGTGYLKDMYLNVHVENTKIIHTINYQLVFASFCGYVK